MKAVNYIKLVLLVLLPLTAFSQGDNVELQKIYNEDQKARMSKNINWEVVSKQDKEREKRVYEMIALGQVKTGKDHYNSAMIFQHGNDTVASTLAVKYMQKALELDTTINRWLLAAAIDRDLMRRNKPQIYGTQFTKGYGDTKWKRYQIDTTHVNDEQRKYYRVETLAQQAVKERNMNLKPVSELYAKSNNIKETVKLITEEKKKGLKSDYNVGENEINSFAYQLLNTQKQHEALEIFTLNTKLYPNGFNAFDSLGECLFLLGRKAEGIKAYKKSLALNPKNENARKIIASK